MRARPAPEDWKLELRVTRAGQAQAPVGCQGMGGRVVGLGSPHAGPVGSLLSPAGVHPLPGGGHMERSTQE